MVVGIVIAMVVHSLAALPLTHAQWYTYSYATQQGLTLHQDHNHLCLYLLGLELIRYEAATGLGGSRVTYTWPHLLL